MIDLGNFRPAIYGSAGRPNSEVVPGKFVRLNKRTFTISHDLVKELLDAGAQRSESGSLLAVVLYSDTDKAFLLKPGQPDGEAYAFKIEDNGVARQYGPAKGIKDFNATLGTYTSMPEQPEVLILTSEYDEQYQDRYSLEQDMILLETQEIEVGDVVVWAFRPGSGGARTVAGIVQDIDKEGEEPIVQVKPISSFYLEYVNSRQRESVAIKVSNLMLVRKQGEK